MLGLLVLLNGHHGSEDVALLADDLDLEIDEILPALDYAEILQLVKVSDGRATFTDLGKKLVAGTIRGRKTILREQLRRTTLFKTLVRALENAPQRELSDQELGQIVSLTTPPSEETIQTIVTWGRYADLFRYDSAGHRLLAHTPTPASKSTGGRTPPPPTSGTPTTPAAATRRSGAQPPEMPGAGAASVAT